MIPRYETRYSPAEFAEACLGLMRRQPEDLSGEMPGISRKEFEMLPVRRGREALFVLLKSANLSPGSLIGVPLFVCSCVPHTIREAGFTPVFMDIDLDTFGLDLSDLGRKAARLDGLVLVYTLGRPADFDAIRQCLPGKIVIEDCAHAIGSTFRGKALGSLGDAAFFSFGFFKPVPAGGGGLIVSRDRDIMKRARDLVFRSPSEGTGETLRHSVTCLAKGIAFSNPAYSLLSRLRQTVNDDGPEKPSSRISSLRMRPSDQPVIEHHLANQNSQTETMDFWAQLRERIPSAWHVPAEPVFDQWNHFMFAAAAPNPESCKAALRQLRASGISAAGLFPNCVREMESAGYRRDCPKSEYLASVALVIPCHRALTLGQRHHILESVTRILGKV